MALTADVAKQMADSVQLACERVIEAVEFAQSVVKHNSNLSIDWAAAETPAYLPADGDGSGNLASKLFSRQQTANALGSLDQFVRLATNQTIYQGDHLGNLNQIARPKGRR